MLLDDVIAAEPGEVVPVADLPLHVAPGRLAVDDPDLAAVPVCLGVEDVADRPVLDPLDRLDGSSSDAAAGCRPRCPGPSSAASSPASITICTPGHIDRPRLLHERVLAGLDGRLQVHRPEMGRSRQDHVVDLGDRQQLLVGVEPGEAAVPRDVDAQLRPARFATCPAGPRRRRPGPRP